MTVLAKDALALLKEKGWGKGLQRRPRICMVDAVHALVRQESDMSCLYRWGAIIWQEYPERITSPMCCNGIPAFNDHPDTTWADVERILEKAIALEEELGIGNEAALL